MLPPPLAALAPVNHGPSLICCTGRKKVPERCQVRWDRGVSGPRRQHLFVSRRATVRAPRQFGVDTVDSEDDDLLRYMKGFAPWENYDVGVRSGNRHCPVDPDYFRALLDRCRSLERLIPHGSPFFRARIMPLSKELDSDPLGPAEMGAPPPELSNAGRLNPEGIPYLYLADTADTALAEVRPWRNARVSVARFTTVTDLRIADLSEMDEVEEDPLDPAHWAAFALSRPAHREDGLAYVSTQLLAENLKAIGFDGVMYDSSLNPAGHNLALFDPSRAVVRDVDIYLVHRVTVGWANLTSIKQDGSLEPTPVEGG